jgi:hypothetical protein
MDRFYVHSEEFWGGTRQWVVFERLPYPDKWRRVSKFFKKAKPAEKICARMIVDQKRYEAAMRDKVVTPLVYVFEQLEQMRPKRD